MVTGKTWLHNNGLIVKQLRSLGVPLWDEVAEATVFLWSNYVLFFMAGSGFNYNQLES